MSKVAFLQCVDGCHDPIGLAHQKPVMIGRGPLTKIKDKRLSRQQFELTADCTNQTVKMRQIGGNPSCIDEKELIAGNTALLKNGTKINLLPGMYLHYIVFDKIDKKLAKPVNEYPSKDIENKISSTIKRRSVHSQDGPSIKRVRRVEQTKSEGFSDTVDESNEQSASEKLQWLQNQAAKRSKVDFKEDTTHQLDVKKEVSQQSQDANNKGKKKIGKALSDVGPCEGGKWEEFGKLIVHTSKGVCARRKIAGFDIDGTIITTISGKVFAQNTDDWRINFQNIPKRIQSLHKDGFKIVFFTNQLGIGRGKLKVADVKKKFENILVAVGVPVQILIATGYGIYRKPSTGMWDHLVKKANDDVLINIHDSFYVGDAAGRPALWSPGRKKDFSKSDRLFALNLGLSFHTPEEYFSGYPKAHFDMPEFDPKLFNTTRPLFKQADGQLVSKNQEVIVLVGSPASGKSTFVNIHLVKKNYVHINRDTLGSWQKCVSECTKALKSGKRVVIDNTSPDIESRKRYISCAKSASVGCRCFVFATTITHCLHNERFRQLTQTPSQHAPLTDMLFHSYKNKFVYPTVSEGFQEVLEVNFIANYVDAHQKHLYELYLLEK